MHLNVSSGSQVDGANGPAAHIYALVVEVEWRDGRSRYLYGGGSRAESDCLIHLLSSEIQHRGILRELHIAALLERVFAGERTGSFPIMETAPRCPHWLHRIRLGDSVSLTREVLRRSFGMGRAPYAT